MAEIHQKTPENDISVFVVVFGVCGVFWISHTIFSLAIHHHTENTENTGKHQKILDPLETPETPENTAETPETPENTAVLPATMITMHRLQLLFTSTYNK